MLGYKLCIAEKQNVAEDIAKIIEKDWTRYKGYMVGKKYIVTWASGHLVGLAEPEEYGFLSKNEMYDKKNPENAQKALTELPIFPDEFKLVVLDNNKFQFNVIQKLMNRNDVDLIIDCGDAGAEGHILQWFIRVAAKCNKPVKRFMATDMSETSIRRAMENLQPIEKYEKIIKGEFCKKKSDWILGMSCSRAASLTYHTSADVGRVQTPTLYFIVERYLRNKTFKPRKFYTLEGVFDGFTVNWIKDTNNIIPSECKDECGRLLSKTYAERLRMDLLNKKGKIIHLETKKKAQNRPQLFNTMDLTKEAIKKYGYNGENVLNIAEKLYNDSDKKITSYPRSDSCYITSDLEPLMLERVKDIATIPKYKKAADLVLSRGLNIDKRIVNDKEVTDHHAIITTENFKNYDLDNLTEMEINILHLIVTRMLVAFSQPYKYTETTIQIEFENGIIMSNSVKVPVDLGYKEVENLLMDNLVPHGEELNIMKSKVFSSFEVGNVLIPTNISVKEGTTTAPPLLTEDDVYNLMEHAGDKLGEEGKILKGRGIGTQATRTGIVKKLLDKKYITYKKSKGKVSYLIPTQQGVNLIKILPQELYSPKLTADWENKIALIQTGEYTEKQFLDEFKVFVTNKVEEIRNKNDEIDFSNSLGTCPKCGKGKIYQGEPFIKEKDGKKQKVCSFYCSNRKSDECDWHIYDNNFGYVSKAKKKLSAEVVKEMLEKGYCTQVCSKVKYKFFFGFHDKSSKYAGQVKINAVPQK